MGLFGQKVECSFTNEVLLGLSPVAVIRRTFFFLRSLYVLFDKKVIAIHHGDNFLFYFDICTKLLDFQQILTMEKWQYLTWDWTTS